MAKIAPQLPIEVDSETGVWTSDALPMLYVPRHFFVNNHIGIEEVLGEMHLPAPIGDALLRRAGEFAPYLDLALACEDEDPARMIALAGRLGLSAAQLNHAQLEALAFADSLQA